MRTRYLWNYVQTVSIVAKCSLQYTRDSWVLNYVMYYVIVIWPPLVDADEIRRLGKRFRKLDLDNSGALSLDEFLSLPELQQNPLVQRVIDIFDEDGNGEVDFKGNL